MTLQLHALDPDDPPEGLTSELDLRGIAIHWRASPAAPATSTRRRARKPEVLPQRTAPWSVQRIAFHAVHRTHQDLPPSDADEQRRWVLAAYALAAASHPIPSDAEIFYEVGW